MRKPSKNEVKLCGQTASRNDPVISRNNPVISRNDPIIWPHYLSIVSSFF